MPRRELARAWHIAVLMAALIGALAGAVYEITHPHDQ